MAKTQSVEVGAVYRASVKGSKVEVRIERETWKGDKHTGWGGINLATNRPTTIKAGTKMTRIDPPEPQVAPEPAPAPTTPPKGGKGEKAAASQAKPKDVTAGTGGNVGKPRTPKADNVSAPRKPGILDLAAGVLAKSKAPMSCAAIVETVLAQKLWATKGKTPAATLYSAVCREIAAKGKDSRFVKTARGLFASSGKGA
jgi:hypothetical protein